MTATRPSKRTLLPTKERCWTKVIKRTTNFTWTIENFSFLYEKNGEKEITSHQFPSEEGKYKWAVKIEPKYDDECDTKRYVSAYVTRSDSAREKIYSQFSISFMDSNGIAVESGKTDHLFCQERPSSGWRKFIVREELLEKLNDDVLVIEVELTCSPEIETSSESIDVVKTDSLTQLSMDFTALYENSKHCDVTVCAGDTEIKAHSQVLTARSPVFAAMFEHDTVEKETKRIDILDIDIETLRALIHFMYSGKTPEIDEKLAKTLFKASDKYAVESLKDISSDYLASNLSTLNVVDIMIFADLYSASDLKKKALKFICEKRKSFDFVKHEPVLQQNVTVALQILKEIAALSNAVSSDPSDDSS